MLLCWPQVVVWEFHCFAMVIQSLLFMVPPIFTCLVYAVWYMFHSLHADHFIDLACFSGFKNTIVHVIINITMYLLLHV